MDNEEDYKKKPRNFGRNAPAEKPKDLKTAVKKTCSLFKQITSISNSCTSTFLL